MLVTNRGTEQCWKIVLLTAMVKHKFIPSRRCPLGRRQSLLKLLIVIVITLKAIIMGSLQEHKFSAVTMFLISSTFLRWPVGLLALCISSFNAFSPESKKGI